MCLSEGRAASIYRRFKVFEVRNKVPRFMYYDLNGSYLVPAPGYWIGCTEPSACSMDNGQRYMSGFHTFETKSGAKEFIRQMKESGTHRRMAIFAVDVAGFLAAGKQYGVKCDVWAYMKIVGREK